MHLRKLVHELVSEHESNERQFSKWGQGKAVNSFTSEGGTKSRLKREINPKDKKRLGPKITSLKYHLVSDHRTEEIMSLHPSRTGP
jgi:hypothetical protein